MKSLLPRYNVILKFIYMLHTYKMLRICLFLSYIFSRKHYCSGIFGLTINSDFGLANFMKRFSQKCQILM